MRLTYSMLWREAKHLLMVAVSLVLYLSWIEQIAKIEKANLTTD